MLKKILSVFAAPLAGMRRLLSRIPVDVTDHKQGEEAARNAQADLARVARLTAMGELAASIAHETNQSLGAIATQANASLRWLNRDNPDLEEVREGLVRIERDALRAGDVIRGLRTLAKRSGPQLSEVDMNNAIEEVLTLTRGEMRRHAVILHSGLYTGNQPVYGDRVQLQQVLLNLIMNSIEAMSTAGLPRVLSVSSELSEAGGVLVTVEDTGAGFDTAIGDRIFESFFTTKPNGMGMGLSICRSIIEAHGGRIWASPRVPRGASFRFIVPGCAPKSAAHEPIHGDADVHGKVEHRPTSERVSLGLARQSPVMINGSKTVQRAGTHSRPALAAKWVPARIRAGFAWPG
jgi:C4-dicarboxylate-specific signal transduction histidine kinase